MDIPNKSPGNNYTANESNQVTNEIQNIIEDTGQTLDSVDISQASVAVASYTVAGNFYQDTGVANSYIINTSTFKAPSTLYDGASFKFRASNACNGPSTINVNSTGAKQLKKNGNSDVLVSNDIKDGYVYTVIYSALDDSYELADLSSSVDASKVVLTEQDVARYAIIGSTYTDSGSANSYIINPKSGFVSPSVLEEGARYIFKANNTNTTSSTLKVANLATVTMRKNGYSSNLSSGDIATNDVIMAVYNLSLNKFETINLSQILRNKSNISTNTSNISTNTSNISSNSSSISTNTSNISTNTSNITNNSNSISSNDSDISSLNSRVTTNENDIDDLQGLSDLFIGFTFPYNGNSVPTGFLACNGAEVSRTTYSKLYSRIGTIHGAGNGSTTFNVPNQQLMVLKGSGSGRSVGSFESDNILSHTHSLYSNLGTNINVSGSAMQYSNMTGIIARSGTSSGGYLTTGGNGAQLIQNTGGSENTVNNRATLMCIYTGVY